MIGLTGRYLNRVNRLAEASLLLILADAEADRSLRPSRGRDQLSQRIEDLAELLIVLAEASADVQFHLLKSLLQPLDGTSDAAQLDERSHDLDVHSYGPVAAKHPR